MPNPLAVLRYRDYAAYAAARFCTTLCWQMLSVAVGWQVYALTRNPLDLGYLGLVQFLPFVLLVLPGGHVADHTDRRLVLITAYTASALCAGTLAWFSLSGLKSVWPIFAVMVVFGAGRAFWMPASQAMTPNLVPPEAFPSAVALNSMLFEAGVIAGPALGGVLYLIGPSVVYCTVAGMLLVAVTLIFTIKPVRARDAAESSQTAESAGWVCDTCCTGKLCSVRSHWTCSGCCLVVLPRYFRLMRAMCCTWVRRASDCCARRPVWGRR